MRRFLWLLLFVPIVANAQYFSVPFLNTNVAASISKTDNAASTASTANYTFTALNIGSAFSGRRIIVCAPFIKSSIPSITSVTIGGVTASNVVTGTSGTNAIAGLYILQVDTGTTADVVVHLSGLSGRMGVVVYAAYNLQSSTATSTASSAASPPSVSLNVAAGGVAVGCGTASGASTPTHTWTGLTEDVDAAEDAANNVSYTAASLASATAQPSLTVTDTPSASTTQLMAAASFR